MICNIRSWTVCFNKTHGFDLQNTKKSVSKGRNRRVRIVTYYTAQHAKKGNELQVRTSYLQNTSYVQQQGTNNQRVRNITHGTEVAWCMHLIAFPSYQCINQSVSLPEPRHYHLFNTHHERLNIHMGAIMCQEDYVGLY